MGLPGAKEGLHKEDVTIAELLKARGYTTGQFGKNHLGDQDEHLPSNHGFDEFFGNLYHLNAEDEPEHADYPKDPAFKKKFGPRGVIHSFADGKVQDTGPLNKKRMETIDEEVAAKTLSFIDKAHKAKKPFFVWFNSTRMHVWTRMQEKYRGVITNQIPVAFLGIKLKCKPTNIPLSIRSTAFAGYCSKAGKQIRFLPYFGKDLGPGVLGNVIGDGEGTVSG